MPDDARLPGFWNGGDVAVAKDALLVPQVTPAPLSGASNVPPPLPPSSPPSSPPSYWSQVGSNYSYYFNNPSKMDSISYGLSVAAWSAAGVAGGGLAGIAVGTVVAGGMAATGVGCGVSTFVGSMIGSSVGATAGGKIGSLGGPISEKIGEIGGGIVGGMVNPVCFVAGTQVVVGVNPDGSYATKSIEDIQVGDYVLTRPQNDPTAPLALEQVTAVFVHQVTQEQVLTIADVQGRVETITCTNEHPFWVPGRGWTAAEDLAPGTELTSPDGSVVVVVSNTARLLDQPVNVYNIDVGSDHTYFVDDGAEPVWVHNCGPVHGNSCSSPRTTTLYKRVDSAGKF